MFDDTKLYNNKNMKNVLEITHKLNKKAKTKVENAWVTSQEAFLYSHELDFSNAYGGAEVAKNATSSMYCLVCCPNSLRTIALSSNVLV